MTEQIIHTIVLITVVALSFGIKPFYEYELFLIALILIIYWLIKNFLVPHPFRHRLIDAAVAAILTVNIVNTTGGVNSPVFFLIYGLMFGLSLLLKPLVSLTTGLTLIIFYLLELPESQTVQDLLPIISIAFITPFALFLGEEYQKILEQKKDIIILKKKNQTLREEINQLIREHERKPVLNHKS